MQVAQHPQLRNSVIFNGKQRGAHPFKGFSSGRVSEELPSVVANEAHFCKDAITLGHGFLDVAPVVVQRTPNVSHVVRKPFVSILRVAKGASERNFRMANVQYHIQIPLVPDFLVEASDDIYRTCHDSVLGACSLLRKQYRTKPCKPFFLRHSSVMPSFSSTRCDLTLSPRDRATMR